MNLQTKKVIRYTFLFFVISFLFALEGCKTFYRMVRYNFADITDYKIFPSRQLTASPTPFIYPKAVQQLPIQQILPSNIVNPEKYLEVQNSVAFIVIHKDSIVYEKYLQEYQANSTVASFSMAKSITSILIGCALEDYFIEDINDPVSKYVPDLNKNGWEKVTVLHVMHMTSGVKFNESYWNPFGEAGQFYYGENLDKQTKNLQIVREPGTSFEYVSGNSQLLGLILKGAFDRAEKLGWKNTSPNKSVTQYAQDNLWDPLGMQYDASWSTDDKTHQTEKTFCCLNAKPIDFAKIGTLYLHKGNWFGYQILDSNWIAKSTAIDTTQGSAWYYQYQWWLPSPDGDFMAHGILGQYIYVNPEKQLVIVRLGKSEGNADWGQVFVDIAKRF